jgi:hypothetical protein
MYPVLFWLHSARREHHLHERLTQTGVRYPVATAARDVAADAEVGPADDVWRIHRQLTGPRRLASLAALAVETYRHVA